MSDKVKQVIVMRRDLRNSDGQKVRTGKLIAQGSHASIAFLTSLIREYHDEVIPLTKAQSEWINGSFFKICVGVDTEQELLDIVEKARTLGVECNLITDLGHTEFNGVPTNTCLALGPDYSSKIDPITGHLKLL
jgi:PTH2 family peptidyl-tRNA hydrolase